MEKAGCRLCEDSMQDIKKQPTELPKLMLGSGGDEVLEDYQSLCLGAVAMKSLRITRAYAWEQWR